MALAKIIPLTGLILDYTIYPRHMVDDEHVRDLMRAIEAGVHLPPIVADKASKRVVDGFHRYTAYQRLHGEAARVAVEWQEYADDAALFEDAVRRNAGHGRKLAAYDQARCVAVAEELKITPERIAAALAVTVQRITDLKAAKTAIGVDARPMPIKATIRHLAQQHLSEEQEEGNRRAGGMRPLYYVNQVVNLLEHDLLDHGDTRLMARLAHLARLLESVVAQAA
jgi:hypothetical protein